MMKIERDAEMRTEQDLLGTLEIPAHIYWGIHTERALSNFPVSGITVNDDLIKSMAAVKKACCLANAELGYIREDKAEAIMKACDEIMTGMFADQFNLDALQGGAGTSTNMNVNEVIANRAIEMLHGVKGDYTVVHPLEDVNLHQSTNDVYPTAIRIAAISGLRKLSQSIAELQGSLQEKEKTFTAIVKIGRTEMQEAVPITLGAEFSAFSEAIARDRWRTFKCEERLRVINLGGTAVGTGLTAPRDYIFLVVEKIREITSFGLARGENLMGETANADSFAEVSGILRAHAVNVIKIANDLRLLNFLGEIVLPDLQAGSSIMPGKINPVMTEAAIQAGIKVKANDFIVAEAASRGTWQINEFLPLVAHALLESIEILSAIDRLLSVYIRNINADETRCRKYFEESPMIIAALLPSTGYEKATELIRKYYASPAGNIRSFLEKELGKDLVERTFSPHHLTALGFKNNERNTER